METENILVTVHINTQLKPCSLGKHSTSHAADSFNPLYQTTDRSYENQTRQNKNLVLGS